MKLSASKPEQIIPKKKTFGKFKKGEKFVKVIELHRPLTPLDVSQIIDKALERESDEDVLVYCSGTQGDLEITGIVNQNNKIRQGTNRIIITNIQKDGIIDQGRRLWG